MSLDSAMLTCMQTACKRALSTDCPKDTASLSARQGMLGGIEGDLDMGSIREDSYLPMASSSNASNFVKNLLPLQASFASLFLDLAILGPRLRLGASKWDEGTLT